MFSVLASLYGCDASARCAR